MGWYVAACWPLLILAWVVAQQVKDRKKALRYAVTLKHSEGAFIGLCTEKRRGHWTFVDVKVIPLNPVEAAPQMAPGVLHVPYRNILYYQEIQETANATQ